MKASKWILAGLLVGSFTGWTVAMQQPGRAVDRGPDPPGIPVRNPGQAQFLKVGPHFIDTSRIAYASRGNNFVLVQFAGVEKLSLNVTGKEEVAAMLRWLDSVSISPPPAQ